MRSRSSTARDAFARALGLRDGFPAETTYRIACCHACLGETKEALDWLRQAVDDGYRDIAQAQTDPAWQCLRDDLRFREMVGLVDTSGMSRRAGWRCDLQFLTREIKRRAYDPFRYISEVRFNATVAEIDRAIPDLTDAQIIVELTKLLHPLGDGHARLRPSEEQPELWQALPVSFYLF